MKVKDLIATLNSFNMDAEVEIRTELGDDGDFSFIKLGTKKDIAGSEQVLQIAIINKKTEEDIES